jgi:hypothetical protein
VALVVSSLLDNKKGLFIPIWDKKADELTLFVVPPNFRVSPTAVRGYIEENARFVGR